MFFLKTKGTGKITNFLEIRDSNFTLIEYIKLNSFERNIQIIAANHNLKTPVNKIITLINNAPFGQIINID